MRRFALSLMLSALALAAFAGEPADHPELAAMAAADQADRASDRQGWDDDRRRKRVLELLATGAVATPRDKLHAALVLQHTPGTVCEGKLGSASPENYLLAHHLARAAFDAGLRDAGPLVAMTLDRYLAFTEGRQRYGTTQLLDLATGEMYLPEVDRGTPDSERAALGLPPLETLLKAAKERPAPQAGDPGEN